MALWPMIFVPPIVWGIKKIYDLWSEEESPRRPLFRQGDASRATAFWS